MKWNWSRIYRYCIFQPCILSPTFSGPAFCRPACSYPGNLVPYFPVMSVGLWSIWSLIVLSIFRPAFSVDPLSVPPYPLAVAGVRDGNKERGGKGGNGREETATKEWGAAHPQKFLKVGCYGTTFRLHLGSSWALSLFMFVTVIADVRELCTIAGQ